MVCRVNQVMEERTDLNMSTHSRSQAFCFVGFVIYLWPLYFGPSSGRFHPETHCGYLYIAVSGAETIVRHTVTLDSTGFGLTTTHFQLTVVKNCGPVS